MNTSNAPIYLIVGNGRAAQHFSHYLTLLNIRHNLWHRRSKDSLEELSLKASHILLLLNDDSIQDFYEENSFLHEKVCIHFSGAAYFKNIYGAHPLFTFGSQLYSLETYQSIPFITEDGHPTFNELFPQLKNTHASIEPLKKALYHSYCVMSGNFTTLLWQNIFKDFEKNLKISPSLMSPYMAQIFSNLMTQSHTALTGPLVRNDTKTIISHLDALAGTAYQNLYYSFISFYGKTTRRKKKLFQSIFERQFA